MRSIILYMLGAFQILSMILYYISMILIRKEINQLEQKRDDVCIYYWNFSSPFLIIVKAFAFSCIPVYNFIQGIFRIKHYKLIANAFVSNAIHLSDPSKK